MIEIPDFQQADVFEDPLHVDEFPAWGRMGKRGQRDGSKGGTDGQGYEIVLFHEFLH